MTGDFYAVLLYSLLLTAGAISLYFGYRYFMARWGSRPPLYKYVQLHNLESGSAKGEIVFFFHVPEEMNLKLEIIDLNDNPVLMIEEKVFPEGDAKVKFDSTKVSDGEYFYRITTAHQQTAKKFRVTNA